MTVLHNDKMLVAVPLLKEEHEKHLECPEFVFNAKSVQHVKDNLIKCRRIPAEMLSWIDWCNVRELHNDNAKDILIVLKAVAFEVVFDIDEVTDV